jgi:glycosyltransferase involved in cell wall biosynthesis
MEEQGKKYFGFYKMKIAILTNNLDTKSGWGRYSLDLISEMQKNGIEVVVLCNRKNSDYANISQIEVLPNPTSFKKTYIGALFYMVKILRIRRLLLDCNMIHCFVEPYAFISYFLSKLMHIKYFLTIHGSFGVKPFANFLYGYVQLFCYKHAEKIICVSDYTRNRILRYTKLDNIVVIPNGVMEDAFCKDISFFKKENAIIGVGAIKKRKGFDVVLKAIPDIRKQIPNLKYCIVGSQNDKKYVSYLNTLIDELGIRDTVFFYENISDKKLKELYLRAKIFVLTPVSDKYNFEGFGLVYLEANACGLPVIGSYGNGGEEAIRDGYNGFLAKANSPENTAEQVIKLLGNSDLYKKMSQNAVDWSRGMLWDNIVKKYLEIYEYER